MIANSATAKASLPWVLESATPRNTGISASRANPIAFGSVHGFSGWSESVAAGGGPERCAAARGDRAGPRDALLIRVLLDGSGGGARRAEPVGPHPHEL